MSYVLASVLWSVAGLVVGYFLGRAGGPPRTRQETPVAHLPQRTNRAALAAWWVARRDQLLGVALIVLAVASVLMSALYLTRQQTEIDAAEAKTSCQNEFNRQSAQVTEQLRQAAALERGAFRHALEVSFTYPTRAEQDAHRPEIVAAYREYLTILQIADKQRSDNPSPRWQC